MSDEKGGGWRTLFFALDHPELAGFSSDTEIEDEPPSEGSTADIEVRISPEEVDAAIEEVLELHLAECEELFEKACAMLALAFESGFIPLPEALDLQRTLNHLYNAGTYSGNVLAIEAANNSLRGYTEELVDLMQTSVPSHSEAPLRTRIADARAEFVALFKKAQEIAPPLVAVCELDTFLAEVDEALASDDIGSSDVEVLFAVQSAIQSLTITLEAGNLPPMVPMVIRDETIPSADAAFGASLNAFGARVEELCSLERLTEDEAAGFMKQLKELVDLLDSGVITLFEAQGILRLLETAIETARAEDKE